MRSVVHSTLLRPALILLFIFIFIPVENNYGLQHKPKTDVLTLEEEDHIKELIFGKMYHQFDSISDICTHYLGFTGNVLLAHDNEIVYQVCSGYDGAQRIRLNPQTSFQLASVSKQFTAMAILILEAEGRLRLDDLLSKYIPELPYKGVTIRHLLNHTSGVPNYLWYIDNYWTSEDRLPNNEDLVRILSEHGEQVNFKPGQKFSYSNTGYALLASVVERISGKSFGSFLTERVFIPLDMENASVHTPVVPATDSSYLAGYRRFRSGANVYQTVMHDGIAGDKGVYASLEDLFKWDQALNRDVLVPHWSIQQAFTAGELNNDREIPYGFGFRLEYEGNSKVVYHYGRWSGFRTAFVKYLPENLTIIVLNNTSFNGVNQIVAAFKETWDHLSVCQVTEDIVQTVLTQGKEEGLILYSSRAGEEKEWISRSKVLPRIALYLEEQGKTDKAKELREFYQALAA
ncbi:MAG: serine hydrolase [Bacteroidales bacterium]|nr:beta-lactamase family protein [Lentimicrobiaceae bacterium]MDD5693701.1 serine hydrolase [Bacteroidales bacterium]